MDHGSSELTLKRLASAGLEDTHEQAVAMLIALTDALPEGCVDIVCSDQRPRWYEIDIRPSNQLAARMTIYLCPHDAHHDDPAPVVVNAGHDIALDIIDMHYDDPTIDIPAIFAGIVRAIIAGNVREVLYYRGDVLYRSRCRVEACDQPIELDRTNVPKWLSSLGKRHSRKTVAYEPYY